MFGRVQWRALEIVVNQLAGFARRLEPGCFTGPEAVRLVAQFGEAERLAGVCKALMAARVAETNQWRRDGDRSPEVWLARRSGSTVGAAKDALATVERLKTQPRTEKAVRSGRLSAAQAALVSDAVAADPSAEQQLLDKAERASVGELRREAERVKANARSRQDEQARERAIHQARSLRTSSRDGVWELTARGTAADGARFMARLQPFIDAEFKRARAEGRRENPEAYGFDALLAMSQSGGSSKPPAKVLVRVDLPAIERGTTVPGEVCEIAGYGPISVATAKTLMSDAELALVLTCGKDVINVTHLNRQFTAHQRTALQWLAPECTADGCTATVRLERDHRTDWAKTRHTRIDDADQLCHHHHTLKTQGTHRLEPGTGKRRMVPVGGAGPPDDDGADGGRARDG